MDNKTVAHIDQLLERYFNAETTLEEESQLRAYYSQPELLPERLQQWSALFADEVEETLGDDFDARIMEAIGRQAADSSTPVVKAREVKLTRRLVPLFKAAAVVAIILTLGGALQAPFDRAWDTPEDYAAVPQLLDSVAAVSPVQAENISEVSIDSTLNMKH